MEEMQPGDVVSTFADTSLLQERFGYKPSTTVETGIKIFYEWFKEFVLTWTAVNILFFRTADYGFFCYK